jgi:hypothetical protein
MPILHYLVTADGVPLSGEAVPLRSLKKHIAHPELFDHETGDRLVKCFDAQQLDELVRVCAALGGVRIKASADLFVRFDFLPRFPIYMRLWMSDDEIPGSGKLLFDSHCLHYLDEMDIHTAGPLFVEYLIKQCHSEFTFHPTIRV